MLLMMYGIGDTSKTRQFKGSLFVTGYDTYGALLRCWARRQIRDLFIRFTYPTGTKDPARTGISECAAFNELG